ncbi:MAG TPA: 2-amino-4-hydroxy-6-hydroxymethyldihydropteridine diphosphokinase, partial [Thermoanaerobaculia bacterium]|nr:2-amino-4-hydroxy-6-hydroxymethyldihydropteridine diphosphokinase [Thermoanaerobaculia bacterium]
MGLGANLGDPRRHLLTALAALSRHLGPLRVAPLYRTEPLSAIPQPRFFNTVVLARGEMPPEAVLRLAKELEAGAGRQPGPLDAPRPLDVDLLLWEGVELSGPPLTLPHPRLRERRFVLTPLAAVAGDWPLPPDGRSVAAVLAALPPGQQVERVPWAG